MMAPSAGPAGFEVWSCRHGDDVVVGVRGELDCATTIWLKATVMPVVEAERPPRTLVLDLAEMSFCDAAGLGALVGLRTACRERDTALVLAAASPMVRRLLVITGLHAAFACHQTVAEALRPPHAA